MFLPKWEGVCYPLYIYDKITHIEKRLGEGVIRDIADRLLQHDLTRGLRLHQIKSTPGYTVDINYRDRLYFSTIIQDNKKCLMLLDIVEHHQHRPVEGKFKSPMFIQFLRKYFPMVTQINENDYVVQTVDGVKMPLVEFFDKNQEEILLPPQNELAPAAAKKTWEPIPLTYHGTSFIHPTEQQEEILASIQYPAFFEGVPGSGKSFIALKILYSQYLTLCQRLQAIEEEAIPFRLLYLCESELLCEQMERNWHTNYPELISLSDQANPIPGKPQILFYTYYQLMTGIKKKEFQKGMVNLRREAWQVAPGQIVEEDYFTEWYRNYLDEDRNRRKLKRPHNLDRSQLTRDEIHLLENAKTVYPKLRDCAHELNEEIYAPMHAAEACADTVSKTHFFKMVLQNIYQHYEGYLRQHEQVDLAFLKIPDHIRHCFAGVVFDEIQDNTDIQINNVYQLIDASELGETIYFAGFYDGHQSLSYTAESKLTAINHLFQKKGPSKPSLQIYQLKQSHRTTEAVIEYLNAVLNLEVYLFGRESKNQYTEIALGENYGKGIVRLLSSAEFEASPVFDKLANSPHVAIITSNEDSKSELKRNPKYADFTQIDTAIDIKGLENEIVIVKGLLSKFIYLSEFLIEKEPLKKLNPGRFKPEAQTHELLNRKLITELHELYVALSRSKKHLLIVEDKKNLDRLTGLIRWLKLFVTQPETSTWDALLQTENPNIEATESMIWHEKMIDLIEHQNFDAAERIFIKKLDRGDSHAFRLWLIEYQNSLTSAILLPTTAAFEVQPTSVSSSPIENEITSTTGSTTSALTPTPSSDSPEPIVIQCEITESGSLDEPPLFDSLENPHFPFKELKRFSPEVVYSFQPHRNTAQARTHENYTNEAEKWLDMLSAYLYIENQLLPHLDSKKMVSSAQWIDWIKNIHRRVGNHLIELTSHQVPGEYTKHCMLFWNNNNITKMINRLLEYSRTMKLASDHTLIAELTKLYNGGINSKKTIATLLTILDKIVLIGSDVFSMQSKLTSDESRRPGYIALRYLPMVYHTPKLLSEADKKIIDKFVKIGMLPKSIPEAVEKYANMLASEFPTLKPSTHENQKIRFLVKVFYKLTQINPFVNANARVASCLMNLFATSLGLPSVLLYYPHESINAHSNSLYFETFTGVDSNEMICVDNQKLEDLIKHRIKLAQKINIQAAAHHPTISNVKKKAEFGSLSQIPPTSSMLSEQELYQQNIYRQIEIAQLIKRITEEFPWYDFSPIHSQLEMEFARDKQDNPLKLTIQQTTHIPDFFIYLRQYKIFNDEYEKLKMNTNPPHIELQSLLTQEQSCHIKKCLAMLTNKREWVQKLSQPGAFKTYVNTEEEGLFLKSFFNQFDFSQTIEIKATKNHPQNYILICRDINYRALFSRVNQVAGVTNKMVETTRAEVKKDIVLQRELEQRINQMDSKNLIDEFFGLLSYEDNHRNEEGAILPALQNQINLLIATAWFQNTILGRNGITLNRETLMRFMRELEALEVTPTHCSVQYQFYTLLLEHDFHANYLMTLIRKILETPQTDSRESYLHFLCKEPSSTALIFNRIHQQKIRIPASTWFLKYHESEPALVDKIPLLKLLEFLQDIKLNPSDVQINSQLFVFFNSVIDNLNVDNLIEYIEYFWETHHYSYLQNLLEHNEHCLLGVSLMASVMRTSPKSICSLSENNWYAGNYSKNSPANKYTFPLLELIGNEDMEHVFGMMIREIPDYLLRILNHVGLPLFVEKKSKSIFSFMLEEGLKGGENNHYIVTLKKIIKKYPDFFGKLGPKTWIIDSDQTDNPVHKQDFCNTVSRLITHSNIQGVMFVNHLLFNVPILFIPWISDALPDLMKDYEHYSSDKQNHLTVFCQTLKMLPLAIPIVIPEAIKAFMSRAIPTSPQLGSSANAFFNVPKRGNGNGVKKIINSMHFDSSEDEDEDGWKIDAEA